MTALPEQTVKHLEFVQAVIARLGNDSFLIKGWSITFTGALIGFATSSKQPELAWIGTATAAAFWALDIYYLRAERLFRALYDRIRREDLTVEPFVMNATSPAAISALTAAEQKRLGWSRVALGATVAPLHATLIVVAATFSLIGPSGANESSNQNRTKPVDQVRRQ